MTFMSRGGLYGRVALVLDPQEHAQVLLLRGSGRLTAQVGVVGPRLRVQEPRELHLVDGVADLDELALGPRRSSLVAAARRLRRGSTARTNAREARAEDRGSSRTRFTGAEVYPAAGPTARAEGSPSSST